PAKVDDNFRAQAQRGNDLQPGPGVDPAIGDMRDELRANPASPNTWAGQQIPSTPTLDTLANGGIAEPNATDTIASHGRFDSPTHAETPTPAKPTPERVQPQRDLHAEYDKLDDNIRRGEEQVREYEDVLQGLNWRQKLAQKVYGGGQKEMVDNAKKSLNRAYDAMDRFMANNREALNATPAPTPQVTQPEVTQQPTVVDTAPIKQEQPTTPPAKVDDNFRAQAQRGIPDPTLDRLSDAGIRSPSITPSYDPIDYQAQVDSARLEKPDTRQDATPDTTPPQRDLHAEYDKLEKDLNTARDHYKTYRESYEETRNNMGRLEKFFGGGRGQKDMVANARGRMERAADAKNIFLDEYGEALEATPAPTPQVTQPEVTQQPTVVDTAPIKQEQPTTPPAKVDDNFRAQAPALQFRQPQPTSPSTVTVSLVDTEQQANNRDALEATPVPTPQVDTAPIRQQKPTTPPAKVDDNFRTRSVQSDIPSIEQSKAEPKVQPLPADKPLVPQSNPVITPPNSFGPLPLISDSSPSNDPEPTMNDVLAATDDHINNYYEEPTLQLSPGSAGSHSQTGKVKDLVRMVEEHRAGRQPGDTPAILNLPTVDDAVDEITRSYTPEQIREKMDTFVPPIQEALRAKHPELARADTATPEAKNNFDDDIFSLNPSPGEIW
ncbi:hypothetical protein ACFL2W_01125, partial [Candidatus Omnitrophota bacterium]